MIRVQSFLLDGDRLVPVEEAAGPVPDRQYVEGAIQLELGGVRVLGTEVVDLVDQLWAYLVNALVEVADGGHAGFMLPDQPLAVDIWLDRRAGILTVEVGDPVAARGTAPAAEAVPVLASAARAFFERMRVLNPGRASYETALGKLDGIERRWPHLQ